jgi:hypothetical protein
MDSGKIAQELERRYPNPPLHLDSPMVSQVKESLMNVFTPAFGIILPLVPRNILSPKSAEYYVRTREAKFGTTFEEYEREKGGDPAWESAKPGIKHLADLLNKEEGPFFLGKTGTCLRDVDGGEIFSDNASVSYADFIFISFLHFIKRVDEDVFARFVSHDAAFLAIYEATRPWLQKRD